MRKGYETARKRKSLGGGKVETKGVGGILKAIWENILGSATMGGTNFEQCLTNYVRGLQAAPDDTTYRVFTKGNLRREYNRSFMTFKVFMKGLKIIGAFKIEMNFRVHFKDKIIEVHRNVDIARLNPNDDESENPTAVPGRNGESADAIQLEAKRLYAEFLQRNRTNLAFSFGGGKSTPSIDFSSGGDRVVPLPVREPSSDPGVLSEDHV